MTTSGDVAASSFTLSSGKIFSDNNGNLINQLATDINGNNNPTKFAFKNAAGMEVMGIDSNGNATIAGTLTTNIGNYDLAEDYPTTDNSVEAGDVVSIDTANDSHVVKSTKPYDNTVIGIFSEKPGFRLSQVGNINGDKAVPVALDGRVPVKVNNENGPIHKGDFLTTSSTPGVAMKATKAGQVLGKALQDFNGISGKITAFVNITFADPTNFLANIGNNNTSALSKVSSDSIDLPENLVINGQEINGSLTNGLTALSNGINTVKSGVDTLQNAFAVANSKADILASKLAELEASNATNSALISQVLAKNNLIDEKISSTSSELVSLSQRIDELVARLSTQSANTLAQELVTTSSAYASASASYLAVTGGNVSNPEALITQDIVSPSVTTISGSSLPEDLDLNSVSIKDSFKSLGSTFLGNTTVSGGITVAGQAYLSDTDIVGKLTVNNTITISENAVNVLGTSTSNGPVTGGILYLQNAQEARGLDILNGKMTIDKNGNVSVTGDVTVGGDLNIEGAITITAIAGENIQAKDALYVSGEGIVKRADATFADKSVVIGLAGNTAKKGSKVTIIIGGKAKGFRNLEAGKKYYLQSNAGMTPTPPLDNSHAISVGIAFTKDELIVSLGK